jgi:hypothetical protein
METEPEQNNKVVRVERSSDSLPIWAPSQYGKEDEREYLLPWLNEHARVVVQKAGKYGLLRWNDKITLASLFMFWYQQGQNPEGWVNLSIADIVKSQQGERGGKQYRLITQSLWRLRGCLIQHYRSFFDAESQRQVSRTQGVNILTYLTIYGYKTQDGEEVEATQIKLNLDVVRNLLGNYTRPVSLDLWLQLSERGGLFESYVNSVLYRNPRVSKDVFDLWEQLGLSTKGVEYASNLTSKMRPDLDKMCADPYGLLREYTFEKSKTKPKSKNLVLHRRKVAYVDKSHPQETSQLTFSLNTSQLTPNELDVRIEQIRFELNDKSTDDTNIRRIVERMPEGVVTRAVTDAVGRVKDGMVKRAVPYFVGRMKKEAKELGISLGFRETTKKQKPVEAEPQKVEKGRGRPRKTDEDSTSKRKAKIDRHYIGLPEREKTQLQETAALKATILIKPESKGFDALVQDNIRRMIAERLRIEWGDE